MWWHLLSLDAPTIAALWSHLFAQAAHVRLTWGEQVVLLGAVWLTYTADRVLDSGSADPSQLRSRHRFARRQRRRLTAAWLLVLFAVAWLSLFHLDRGLFASGCGLLGGVLFYLYVVHRAPHGFGPDWMKRIVVALIFSLGTALPAWRHAADPATLLWPAVAFAGLCFLNCTAIETWESERPHGCLGPAMALSAGALVLLSVSPLFTADRVALLACALSAVGLAVIDAARSRLSAEAVRVLADVALLTAAVSLGLA
jgi:hypothetical protein